MCRIALHLSVCTVRWSPAVHRGMGRAFFKDVVGHVVFHSGKLAPVTPSFHHRQLPANPAYINFLQGLAARRQRGMAAPAPPNIYIFILLSSRSGRGCYVLMRRRVCRNKRPERGGIPAVAVGLRLEGIKKRHKSMMAGVVVTSVPCGGREHVCHICTTKQRHVTSC